MKNDKDNQKSTKFIIKNDKLENSNEFNASINKSISFKALQEQSDPATISISMDIENITYIPTIFISYCHDNDQHLEWVKSLAEDLITKGGINTILDQWDLNFGNSISNFMEKIESVDKIIIVCSPLYKIKANNLKNGVGYEKRIIVQELKKGKLSRIIPITPFKLEDSTPIFLFDIYIAVFNEQNYDEVFLELVRNIYSKPRIEKPPLGEVPEFIT